MLAECMQLFVYRDEFGNGGYTWSEWTVTLVSLNSSWALPLLTIFNSPWQLYTADSH